MYADKVIEQVVSWRRDIHEHPELSQHEERTSSLVAGVLEGLGLEVMRNVGGYGVVGLLRGNACAAQVPSATRGDKGGSLEWEITPPQPSPSQGREHTSKSPMIRGDLGGSLKMWDLGRSIKHTQGRTVALRADMDALPLTEATGLPFASKTPGVMHACGHDTHTAMLLGAASVLAGMREELKCNAKFIFQPAEELNPTGGAPGMIRDGVLENPQVDALFALHVWPALETGKVAVKPGALMAASDRVFITVKGKSAHGSRPDQGIDAVVAAAHVITGLQGIISRSVSPLDSAVLTIGTIHGGDRYNVIPERVDLEGTVRTLNPGVQERMPEMITRTARGIAEGLGAECEVKYVKGYPPLVNDSSLAELASLAVRRRLGDDALVVPGQPDLTAEDFAFFARERPAVMAWLGCRPKNVKPQDMVMLHNTKFCPDEECLKYGIEYLVGCALDK